LVEWAQRLGMTDDKLALDYMCATQVTDIVERTALRGAPTPEIIAAVRRYGTQYGIDPQTLLDIIAFETGGTFDPHAQNPRSSASGLFQITGDTWNDLRDRMHLSLDNVFDVDQNVQGGAANLAAAIHTLKENGIDAPTAVQIYFAHQQGGSGASALLNNPDMSVLDALAQSRAYRHNPAGATRAILQNGGTTDMTAGDFFIFMTARFRAIVARTPRIDQN
jgi:hypothetical protein